MQRIDTATVIPLYSFHTEQLREHLLRVLQNMKNRLSPDMTYICNFIDFVDGCISTDMYSCCGLQYTPQVFMNTRMFLDSYLTSGAIQTEYLPYFRKTLRLFGIETCILTVWLRHCFQNEEVKVIPTLPLLLINNMVRDQLISVNYADTTDMPTRNEWLDLTGSICREFTYAAMFPFVEALKPEQCLKNHYNLYMFQLLNTLRDTDFKTFTLFREESND